MKIIKKISLLIVSFFTLVIGKVIAFPVYGILPPPEEPTVGERIISIIKIISAPIILLVGIIVFVILKKKKNRKSDKNEKN